MEFFRLRKHQRTFRMLFANTRRLRARRWCRAEFARIFASGSSPRITSAAVLTGYGPRNSGASLPSGLVEFIFEVAHAVIVVGCAGADLLEAGRVRRMRTLRRVFFPARNPGQHRWFPKRRSLFRFMTASRCVHRPVLPKPRP
jgi:hypothetical protein